MVQECDKQQTQPVKPTSTETLSADALIDDLIDSVKHLQKPFSMDDLADEVKKHKKHSKEKKHKKKKKSKKSHKHRQSSRSRSKSRSPKVKRSKRSPSVSSSSSNAAPSNKEDQATMQRVPSDDDLPLGADFSTLQHENEKQEKGPAKSPSPQIEMPTSPFPLSKRKRRDSSSPSPPLIKPLVKPELLRKVIEEQGKGDLIPRSIKKIAIAKLSLPTASTSTKIEEATPIPKKPEIIISSKAPQSPDSNANATTKTEHENSISHDKQASSSKQTKKRNTRQRSHSSSSGSEASDTQMKKKLAASGIKLKGMHIDREEKKKVRMKRSKRSKSGSSSRSRSRTRSKSRNRSRSRSRSFRRSRSPRRRYSRSRSRERRNRRGGRKHNRRNRSRARNTETRERIDKQKLLETAQKKVRMLQQMGIMDLTDPKNHVTATGKSIDELVDYCTRVSKREQKDEARKKGEAVSSDSEFDDFLAKVKHPYAVNTQQAIGGITINIANAVPLAIRAAQDRVVDESTLRICYPVSSGVIHKQKADSEFRPVIKDPVPITVTNEVKKHKAITSLQAQEARQTGKSLPNSVLIPPPPMPPSFDSLLSGPGAPPTFSDTLLPPPPLPPMFVPSDPANCIIKERPKITKEPLDLGKIMANRAAAAQRIDQDPNDYEARRQIKKCDEEMEEWAVQGRNGGEPGKFTGSTGVRTLTAEELQPLDPRYNAWVKKEPPGWQSPSSSSSPSSENEEVSAAAVNS